jgi:oligopeptide/dipeptide ABC transporter ATP-binding protein
VSEPLLRVRGLEVRYALRSGPLVARRRGLVALRGMDLDVAAGQAVGVVGESGCGKSTLARAILALVEPRAGTIEWRGEVVRRGDPGALRRMRRELQVVFQDPVGSLDPRMTIAESVGEALEALEGLRDRGKVEARVAATLAEVGLDPALGTRYPHELSGGQCQRAAIARAIVARPRLLICDEAVSALDVSVQAQIVNLLDELRRRHGLAMLFISHNLAVVRHLCDEVVVMYLGRLVERGPCEAIFASPRHPYTRALLEAVPNPDPAALPPKVALAQPVDASAGAPTAGCVFAARCPLVDSTCRSQSPLLADTGGGHASACHHWHAVGRR